MNSDEDRVGVVFLGGFGRSGSTLLDLLLGQLEDFVSIGELGLGWQRGFVENQLCGCTAQIRECDFWTKVVEEGFGSFERFDRLKVGRLHRRVDRLGHIPRLLVPALRSRGFSDALIEYGSIIYRLLNAVRRISGRRLIVDSTKYPSHGFVLRTVTDIDLLPVHLIRDSRAVAFSWQRKRQRPEIHWERQLMPRFSGSQSAYRWMRANMLMELLGCACRRSVRIRYEDFIADPGAVLETVARAVAPGHHVIARGGSVRLGVNHTIAGNPLRFERGEIRLRLDDEWRAGMDRGQYRTVTAMTLPLLFAYGYRWR